MTFTIRAFIFDLDGVIADTLTAHDLSWQRLAAEEGLTFTAEQYKRMQGLARRESLDIFLNGLQLDEPTAQAWMDRKNRYFRELLDQFTPGHCKPGAATLIAQARAAGLKVGLGSSSQNALRVIDKLGLTPQFDVMADGNTVTRNKPAPDIFLWVAAQLGVSPAETVIFEDSDAGLQAALAGGFWVVGVGGEHNDGAHLAVGSLDEISAVQVCQQIETLVTGLPEKS
ncbi:MAG: beta-phosphoglucomutase family hydrolase [Anaerolineae bacterium]|nr:beta-phosphoglucomutase family hydrolase [Anaerolineae bacterium]